MPTPSTMIERRSTEFALQLLAELFDGGVDAVDIADYFIWNCGTKAEALLRIGRAEMGLQCLRNDVENYSPPERKTKKS